MAFGGKVFIIGVGKSEQLVSLDEVAAFVNLTTAVLVPVHAP
jgi:hypothetical protein